MGVSIRSKIIKALERGLNTQEISKELNVSPQYVNSLKRALVPDYYNIHDYLSMHTRVSPSGCLEWLGTLDRNGYGKLRYNNEVFMLHQLSYKLYVGDLTKGMHICHTCDNRRCWNPKHLYKASAKHNAQDRAHKVGMRRRHYGETNSKL